jgi:hypothetical protein
VQLLLEHGAKLDIFSASILGRADVVRQLLADNPGLAGATRDRSPFHAITLAVQHGHPEIVRLLIKSGAPLRRDTRHGISLPHEAVRHGRRDVLELLLSEGFRLDDRNKGATLLHAAAAGAQPQMVEYLCREIGLVCVVMLAEMTSEITFLSVTSVPPGFEFLDGCAERLVSVRLGREVKHRGTENTEMTVEHLERGSKSGSYFGPDCYHFRHRTPSSTPADRSNASLVVIAFHGGGDIQSREAEQPRRQASASVHLSAARVVEMKSSP